MHDEMVERVAKAIAEALIQKPEDYYEAARVAIEAMREPTDAPVQMDAPDAQ